MGGPAHPCGKKLIIPIFHEGVPRPLVEYIQDIGALFRESPFTIQGDIRVFMKTPLVARLAIKKQKNLVKIGKNAQ